MRSAEHGDEGAHHSGSHDDEHHHHFTASNSVDEIENADGSESDNGEFITIKVTNVEGKTEENEVDRIKEAKEYKSR